MSEDQAARNLEVTVSVLVGRCSPQPSVRGTASRDLKSFPPNNQAALPTRENGLLVKTNFLKYFNVIWVVQSPAAKIFRFSNTPNQ
jgi:hypothetical protein